MKFLKRYFALRFLRSQISFKVNIPIFKTNGRWTALRNVFKDQWAVETCICFCRESLLLFLDPIGWPSCMSRPFCPAHDSGSRAKLWLSPLCQVFISQHCDTLCAKTCVTLNTAVINDKQNYQIRSAAWTIFTMRSDTISGFVRKLLEILWKQKASLDFLLLRILHNLKIYM